MNLYNIKDFTKGWVIGNFSPNIIKTDLFEIAVKQYNKGDKEKKHFHKIATEITIVISGKIRMNDYFLEKGEIITLNPGEAFEFEALEDCVTVVVKTPSALDDKFEVK
jgi:quercetin dioxygenase-like cupin family protein